MLFLSIKFLLMGFCSIFYRIGGMSKEQGKKTFAFLPEWVFNTKARDVGCALVGLIWMTIFVPVSAIVHLTAFILLFAALTTYWDFIFKKDNFFAHGFVIGLAYLPYAIATGNWPAFIVRAITLAVFMGLWCKYFDNDDVEELGRGAIIIATLPFLL